MTKNNDWNGGTPVPVNVGGTGVASPTAHSVLIGEGTSPIDNTGVGTNGQVLISGGAGVDPSWVTPSANNGLTVTTNSTTLEYLLTTPIVVSNGGTGATSYTAYSVICGGTTSTGALQNVSGVGTSGQVLTSQGASSLPTWSTAPTASGCWTLLSSQTASSSSSIAFTSLISTTYLNYMVVLNNIVPATNSVSFAMTMSTNNGSSYLSSNYLCGVSSTNYNSSSLTNTTSTTNCVLVSSNDTSTTGPFYCGVLYLAGLDSTAMTPNYYGNYTCYNGSAFEQGYLYGTNTTTSGVTAISFAMSSGNISSGTFTLFGFNN